MLTVEEMVDRGISIPHRDQPSVQALLLWRTRTREGRRGQTCGHTYEKSRTSSPDQPVFKLSMREWFCLFLTWPTSNSSFSYSSSYSSSSLSSPSFNSSPCAPQRAQYVRGFYFKKRGLWSTACTPIPTELNDCWHYLAVPTTHASSLFLLALVHTSPLPSSTSRHILLFVCPIYLHVFILSIIWHIFFLNCRCLIVAIMATTSIATDF